MLVRYSALMLLLCCAWAPVASAGWPDPAHCVVPMHFVSCPAGDVQFRVFLKDLSNMPIGNFPVTLDFATCPNVVFCNDCCPGVTIDRQARTATMTSAADGSATFSLKQGGLCPGSTVVVRCGIYTILGAVVVTSTDQDGDLDVDDADVAAVRALIGSNERGADFDFNGWVTQADVDWLTNNHLGHSCTGAVPARTRTWGGLKVFYR